MRRALRAAVSLGVFFLVTSATTGVAPGTNAGKNGEPITVNAEFSWNGVRNCAAQRPGSVICIAAQANIPGLGLVEYARDAVPNGQTTPDGCPEFSTQGTLWVPGGMAKFDGTPVPTCGANDDPDAHYALRLHDGTGVLAGATGTGDVVADNGVDRWRGSITLAAHGGGSSSGKSSSGVIVGGAAAAAVAVVSAVAGAAIVLSRRRARRARRARQAVV